MNNFNFELERAVIGAMLYHPELFDRAEVAGVTANAFTGDFCRRVFSAMVALAAAGASPDLVQVGSKIPGDISELCSIEDQPTRVNFADWCKKLLRLQAARIISAAADAAQNILAENPDNQGDAIAAVESGIATAETVAAGGNPVSLDTTSDALVAAVARETPEVFPLFPPRTEGDDVFLRPGEMMVIGARSGAGKTAFAAGAVKILLENNRRVAYFCTETATPDIYARIVSQFANIPHWRVFSPGCPQNEKYQFCDWSANIRDRYRDALFVHGADSGRISAGTIARRLRAAANRAGKIDVVVIDFLQMISPDPALAKRSKLEQFDDVITHIHDMLAEYHAAGLVLSQFNRTASFIDAPPDLGQLKDSSMIEQLAHCCAFLYRKKDGDETQFYSRKTRNSAPFDINLKWDGVGYVARDRFAGMSPQSIGGKNFGN